MTSKSVLKTLPPLLMTSISKDGLEATAEGLGTADRRKILCLLVRQPMTREEIADSLGAKSRASVYRNLDALMKLGLLVQEKRKEGVYYHAKTWSPPNWVELIEELDLQSEEVLHDAYFSLDPAINEIVMKVMQEKPELLPEWAPCPLCDTSHGYYEFFMNLFVLVVQKYLGSDDFDAHLDLLQARQKAKK